MTGRHLVAIDAGTGSCRAVVFDGDGRQLGLAQREWSHAPVDGHAGSQRFDTDAGWALICACVSEALRRTGVDARDVAAVAATSMREGIVLYDEDGRELWACPNADSRAADESRALIASGDAQRIYDIAGDWIAITSPPRLLWLQAHEPEVIERAAHLTMLSDWVVQRLSGRFATDPSCGASSGMFDLRRRTWSDEIVAMCGVDRALFPEVVEPGTVIGEVTPSAAAATGLAPGTPVVVGGADTQLALVGLGRVDPGRLTVIGGTFWQHAVVLDEPVIDPGGRLRTLCHAVPDEWMLEGIGFLCGLTLRWFRDGFCRAEVEEARRRGVDPYTVMEERAATVPPGSNGVVGLFSNVMDAQRWVHASPSFLQFDVTRPQTSGSSECIRAIEESAAYVVRGHKAVIEELLDRDLDALVFTGGASCGALWPQILADATGVPVHVSTVKESAALGCALFAGLGAGLYPSLDDARDRVGGIDRICTPDSEAARQYDRLHADWQEIYRRSLAYVDDDLLQPLWRAAGT